MLSVAFYFALAASSIFFINCPSPTPNPTPTPTPANGTIVSQVDCPSADSTAKITGTGMHLLFPAGFKTDKLDTFKVGDVVQIKWCFPTNYVGNQQIRIRFSPNNGRSWLELGTEGVTSGYPVPYPTNTYNWTVTDSQTCSQCRMKVQDYPGDVSDFSDTTFTITAQ